MRKFYTVFALNLLMGWSVLTAQGSCEITNLVATPHLCIDGMFLVDIDFDIVDPEGDIFGIVGNATNYGFFSYDSLPVMVGPLEGDGETEWEFIVYDLGNPNCQATVDLGIIDCCAFTDVVIDQITCTGLDAFRARIDFEFMNTGNVGFEVFDENGSLLGFFPYGALPVTVNGIPSEGIRTTFITICDNDSPNCCTDVFFEDPDCNPNDCEIYNLSIISADCETGQFLVALDFDFENVGATFSVIGNGTNYGVFEYTQLPITIGPLDGDGETVYEFLIRDGMDASCTVAGTFGPVECPAVCGFIEMTANPLHCLSDTTIQLELDFVPVAVGDDGFSVYGQGQFLASFPYGELPVIIEGFPLSGDFFDAIVVCDNADPLCCDTLEFQSLACDECLLYNLVAVPTVCDSNNQFTVTIDFDFWNVSDEGFQLGGNGTIYGNYSYDQVPVTLGPFDGDSTFFYEFIVVDLGGGFCLAGTEMGIVDCDCGFEEITVELLECTGNGFYSLVLDFLPVDVMSTSFDVYAGDDLIGYFQYADLPVVIEHFPQSGDDFDVITICDNDNPTCCASYEFGGLDCSCEVFELVATPLECDTSTSTFGLIIDFQWEGNVESFTAYMGDDEIGQVLGSELPDTLYGLTSPGGGELITVCANEISECCTSVEIEAPQCGEEPCAILELAVEVLPCNSQSQTFGIIVDFDWTGEANLFDIFLNGEQIGFVPGVNLPITIDGLTSEGGGGLVTVCANDMPDCCAMLEVSLPQCPEPCDITELVAEAFACDTMTNTFALFLDFDWTGSAESFDVFFGGEFIGVVNGADLPDTIYNLTSLGGGELVKVCANDNPECCGMIEIEAPQCGEEPCTITELTAEVLPCDTVSETFAIVIDFDFTGSSDFFDVFLSGEYVAFIHSSELPDTIFGLTSEGGGELLKVCANDAPDCCSDLEIVAPQCGEEPCSISELVVEVSGCDSNTNTFNLTIDFVWTGEVETFDVFLDGESIGLISGTNLPVVIDGLIAQGGGALLKVCANDRPDCCAMVEIELPECGQECSIFELSADPGQCTSDSTFTVSITFGYTGFTNEFVEIWTGSNYLGLFEAAQQPIVISSFPWNGNEVMPLTICQNDNPECCAVIEFEVPQCNSCDITALIVEVPGTCNPDSMSFPVFIDIEWTGNLNGFDIYAGDDFLEFIEPSQLPYTLAEFPLPQGGNAVITVCAHDNMDCCATMEFTAPNCSGDSCRIYEVAVDVGECTTDSTFGVFVDYQTEGFSGDLEMWANGTYLGSFPQIHPIFVAAVPETAGVVELTICAADNPDCCRTVTFEGKVCGGCSISDLVVTTTECDSADMFYAILTFEYENIGNGFTVAGNSTQYGVFTYNEVPLTLGPLAGNGTTQWEFVVQDLENLGCLDFFDLGIVDCTTGLFDVGSRIQSLDIFYSNSGAFFITPEHATEMRILTYDGKLISAVSGLNPGERVRIDEYIDTPGLYLIHVTAADRMYVGKVVGME